MPRSPQADFTRALREPSSPTSFPPERFAIYRNNRIAALAEALSATYAATQRLVGERFFGSLAHAFINAHPPRTPVLHEYGAEFPGFIDSFEAASSLPYLADVARIEWAWMRAYHAADCEPLGTNCLFGHKDEDVEGLVFALHPSASLIRSAHPAATIWQMNTDGGTPGSIESWHGENVLVVRPKLDVAVRVISDPTALFLTGLDAGLPLGLAAEAARKVAPDFDLPAQLAAAFDLGLVAGVALSATEESRL